MKAASAFEVIVARAWNLLNEGKSFYPIFNLGLLFLLVAWDPAWRAPALAAGGLPLLLAVALTLPLVATYIRWDFPLHLRWFLWPPLLVFGALFGWPSPRAVALSAGLYFFFTVIVWGTVYYHLRTGTTLWNFLRFWKLVLKNADSTSGNAQEQLPKSFLTLAAWQYLLAGPLPSLFGVAGGTGANTLAGAGGGNAPGALAGLAGAAGAGTGAAGGGAVAAGSGMAATGSGMAAVTAAAGDLVPFLLFSAALVLYAYLVHRFGFTWRPAERGEYATAPAPLPEPARRVIVIVIDGCRKDKLERAGTPFLDWLARRGTRFEAMETVYPARTVVCFSSMFTGTYPREHGITSNLVLRLGVRVESVFDVLARHGRKGVLLGIAHLIDAFGGHVRAITSVQNGDEVDGNIMAAARQILTEEDPDLLVVQLIATDQTGHARGVHYAEYLRRIREADAHIEGFFAWLHERGYTRDTTFLICADHGQGDGIGGHGHLGEGERWVPFFLAGKNVARGRRVSQRHSIVSVAATLMHLLGLPLPGRARGPVLTEALEPGAPDLAEELAGYFGHARGPATGEAMGTGGMAPVGAVATTGALTRTGGVNGTGQPASTGEVSATGQGAVDSGTAGGGTGGGGTVNAGPGAGDARPLNVAGGDRPQAAGAAGGGRR